ncbi:MAG: hypothetical protein AB1846_02895 [Chloroflexota bacterium]
MNLGFFPSGDTEKDLIQKLEQFAHEIEHKFQEDMGYDIEPTFLKRILRTLKKLSKVTKSHATKGKISKIEIRITAAIRYYLDNKYEEYFERVKVIADQLKDLNEYMA